ncbi:MULTISPECIES: PQQ-like beta-propeller repeat protein [unclassified Ruegeria]|uniref:PQQ-like beta-propeller repeat protein n=1 Tax=unclassified Ruegeria TaxID=2625375 RepID=UPI0014893523|nr:MULTISPECIES: PQQ-like beta-propeller repeat protein [unclassified Ruegeria]NOD77380.1 PQQ-binding-like beta-propeller repeat protein [Ruegeria sp. HKCCD4332]NOD87803.1 PQQ-binding-like beta-propeller repeat protein [Ruegeria sp. HKCCD4318]NOE14173.1 PQQ-binding-like beta-propeller repeat protein [Ruegeria sp. HKCCD4318-2]NOG08470.1 PQQ-binding-like beta-propeller repeat protein [Ruegeria sp. HKCCD4315]
MVTRLFSRVGLPVAALALTALAACEEPEPILPGEREDIRPLSDLETVEKSGSQPISLPSQQANASWSQSPGTPAYRTTNAALRATPQRIWSTSIGQGDSRKQRITAEPVVAGGLIYTLDAGAIVSAVTPQGQVAWETDLIPSSDGDSDATGGGMAYADGVLYVSSGYGRLTALDAKTGAVRWQKRLQATGSGAPLVNDGLLYLVAGDETGWTIATKDGRIAWQIESTPSVGNVLGAPAPVIASDLAVFAFGSGDVAATFRRGGIRRWNASVAGGRRGRAAAQIVDVTGGPMVSGDTIYIGNHSGRTVAFDVATGERRWTADEGAVDAVWPAGNSIFLISDRSQLVRLNAADGSVVWAQDLPGFVKDKRGRRGPIFAHYGPILAGGRIVIASNDGYLRFFNPVDGTLVHQVEVPGGATTAPVVAGQTLYVVSTKGDLHAFR